MFQVPSLDKLVHEICRLPGVGPKSAQRLTHYLLKNPGFSQSLRGTLRHVEETIVLCKTCFNYTDNPEKICRICENPHRSQDVICIVEQPEDILQIESSGAYSGLYHVLHGALSPLDDITPEKLKIQELVNRLRASKQPISEVILAVDSDIEGDTTVLYLNRELRAFPLRMTRLAQGIPMGSDIDYIDDRTLHRALSHRTEV